MGRGGRRSRNTSAECTWISLYLFMIQASSLKSHNQIHIRVCQMRELNNLGDAERVLPCFSHSEEYETAPSKTCCGIEEKHLRPLRRRWKMEDGKKTAQVERQRAEQSADRKGANRPRSGEGRRINVSGALSLAWLPRG